MPKAGFKSVDDYIASQPEGVQGVLGRVRSTISKHGFRIAGHASGMCTLPWICSMRDDSIRVVGGAFVNARGLVVFDLDGTLLRGPTVCEVLAAPLGRLERMKVLEAVTEEWEIAEARAEMARWYREVARHHLLGSLMATRWAPGAHEGVRRLRAAGMEVAIASITWEFAVAWFAQQLGVGHVLGTGLGQDGTVHHVWPQHKAEWLHALASRLAVPFERTAAVGDSLRDLPMLHAAALRLYVGRRAPSGLNCVHLPDGDIEDVANRILSQWSAGVDL